MKHCCIIANDEVRLELAGQINNYSTDAIIKKTSTEEFNRQVGDQVRNFGLKSPTVRCPPVRKVGGIGTDGLGAVAATVLPFDGSPIKSNRSWVVGMEFSERLRLLIENKGEKTTATPAIAGRVI